MNNDAGDLETLVIRVRADTGGFMAGVADMRRALDGPLARDAARAGSGIERALTRAASSGKLGFEDLRRVAVAALADIAVAAAKADISGGGAGGIVGAIAGVAGALLGGRPGRATGGPVSAGRAYMVGERGPELFVPTAAGRIDTGSGAGGRGAANITINVTAPRDASPALMTQTASQLARAVRQALARADA